MTHQFRGVVLALAILQLLSSIPSFAQSPPAAPRLPRGSSTAGQAEQLGSIVGTVVDESTGKVLPAAQVRISELGRGELSHGDGSFHFERLPAGSYTLRVQRVGYAPIQRTVPVVGGRASRVDVSMIPSAITLEAVVVTATGRERGAGETYRPTSAVGGAELRRELGSSVAATLAREPGITQRYNGPAAAQPVIRGLSGDRVLMLEDGQRTGDLASNAADHAVTIDPLTAERIEVVRGPAALLHGSNALGGVVNVIREEVPRSLPERLTGTLSAQAESVNDGVTAGASALVPIGSLALRGEASARTAGDTRTPLGPLPSTQMDQYSAALGASWIRDRGFAGFSVRDIGMKYGVPGEFNGELIPGAHEGGATIDLRRTAVRLETEHVLRMGPFRALEADASYVRFQQDEIEPGGVVGSRFGQLTGTGDLTLRHQHHAGEILNEGAFGFWALARDFNAVGGNTGTRPARQYAAAGYLFEEVGLDRLSLQAGARYDWSRITPLEGRPSAIGDIRTRNFGAFSGSLGARFDLRPGWSVGGSLARAFRTPSIEELFSNGPHLADFSFNVGNPDLKSEFGLGADAFVRAALPRLQVEISAFRNAITNYIYYAPTGRLDPRLGRFPVYQARGDDAVLVGGEGRFQWEGIRNLVFDGSASYVRGTRTGDDTPLPAIPPLQGLLGARYERPAYFLGLEWEAAGQQKRVADTDALGLETPTPGYALLNLTGGLRWTAWSRLHTLTLTARNLTDEEWRQHLSRIKDVAPQPGRNVQLLYRLSF